MQNKILIIDINDNHQTIDYLIDHDFEVIQVDTLNKATILLQNFNPDVVLIDLINEQPDGIEIFEDLKKEKKLNNTVFSFYSEKNDDYLIIMTLNMGADDFIIKPIKPKLLLSKLESLIRRNKNEVKTNNFDKIKIKNLIIDHETYKINFNSQDFSLTKKEFEILKFLTLKNGKVLTREQIIFEIWNENFNSKNRVIDVHIRKIREKISKIPLKTIKGIGYKLDL